MLKYVPQLFFCCKSLAWFLILRITLGHSPWKIQRPQQAAVLTCSGVPWTLQGALRTAPAQGVLSSTSGDSSLCFSFLIQTASQVGDQEFVCWSLYCHIRELCTEMVFKAAKLVYASEILNLQSVLVAEKSRKTEWIPCPTLKYLCNNVFFLEKHTWKDCQDFRFSWKAGVQFNYWKCKLNVPYGLPIITKSNLLYLTNLSKKKKNTMINLV